MKTALKAFAEDRSGNFLILSSVVMAAMAGVGALAIDVSNGYLTKNRLQIATDAASLAAVALLPDQAAARSRALTLIASNVPSTYGTVTKPADVEFGTYDSASKTFLAGSANVNAVRVKASRTEAAGNGMPTAFAGLLGKPVIDVRASAIAVQSPSAPCFIVLNPSATAAFSVGGDAGVNVPNCGIWVNSNASPAAVAGNATSVKAAEIRVGGNYVGNFSPNPIANSPPIADPLASLPEPESNEPCSPYSDMSLKDDITLDPGTYCGNITLGANGTTSLSPGIYYLKGATLSLKQKGGITGDGVMIFADKDSSIDFGSNGKVDLSAPTSGPYQGILIFQSRNAKGTGLGAVSNAFTGGPDVVMNGTFYTPTVGLTMVGNGNLTNPSKSAMMIVDTFTTIGTPNLDFQAFPDPTKSKSRRDALAQ